MEETVATRTASVFDTAPSARNLDIYDDVGVDPKKVAKFLDLTKGELAEAAGAPKGSVRYDERIPSDVYGYFVELATACEMVAEFFKGDVVKTGMWLRTRNPMLGNISPRDMIRLGRFSKLMRFIQNARAGERP
jgi:hypothetical protein